MVLWEDVFIYKFDIHFFVPFIGIGYIQFYCICTVHLISGRLTYKVSVAHVTLVHVAKQMWYLEVPCQELNSS